MTKVQIMAVLLVLLLTAAAVPVVVAAEGQGPTVTIAVTTTDPAANPGDGDCSLIEAIDNANADSDSSGGDCPAGNGADEIMLGVAEDYILITPHNNTDGDNGLPVIDSPITISGQGSTIERDDAAPAFRILYVASGGELTLNDLTVRNGASDDVLGGGGIRNQGGLLTLNGSTVSDNEAIAGAGGGVYTRAEGQGATTTISHSDVISNLAATGGGGLYVIAGSNVTGTLLVEDSRVNHNLSGETAGGIQSTRVSGSTGQTTLVNIARSEVKDNSATNDAGLAGGGGLGISYTELTIVDSDISENSVTGPSAHAGGILIAYSDVTIVRSTLSYNTVYDTGGPFQLGGGAIATTDSVLTIANSTLGENSSAGNTVGGALLVGNLFGDAPSIVSVVNSTIAGNEADDSAGALIAQDFGTGQPVEIYLVNSIVAGNFAPDGMNCVAQGSATITSLGHNLEDLDSCDFDQAGDLVNTDPLLGPLQGNGGPTSTYALQSGSPAIDAADGPTCAASPVDGSDQRSVSRPQGPECDIGAFEWRDVPTDVSLTGFSGAAGPGGMVWVTAIALLVLMALARVLSRVWRA